MLSLTGIAAFAVATVSLAAASPANFPLPRQAPADPTGVKTIKSPGGAEIRYKEPGKDGVCETTPGVNSYSGYISLNETTNMFFWFFEARKDPENAPLTLWLNGGPGSDSLIGLFQELGPCNVTEDLETQLNPYAWNELSNMLFLSQPIGVGFSYETTEVGYYNGSSYPGNVTSEPIEGETEGRYSLVDPERYDTTYLSAVGAWEILQGFLENLPTLDNTVQNKTFNLWTESYGGHYGPTFYNYFYEQNEMIANGSMPGCELHMDTLGIINGIVDELIQAPYYPEFARYNTYGIEAVNQTIYDFMKTSYWIPGGCRDQILYCAESDVSTDAGKEICADATDYCRGFVEQPYYYYGNRGVYDIRHPYDDPTPPDYFVDYLNQADVQNALGVNINYTRTSSPYVGAGFAYTGDFVYRFFLKDLEEILDNDVRVALIYGDADYICNWYGGEAVSKQLNYTDAADFRASGYVPFTVDGEEYGEVREAGRFSFTRIYQAGHEVPYYQPKASLELFRRVLGNLVIADGSKAVTPDYGTDGNAEATHTESFVPLPPSATASASGGAVGW